MVIAASLVDEAILDSPAVRASPLDARGRRCHGSGCASSVGSSEVGASQESEKGEKAAREKEPSELRERTAESHAHGDRPRHLARRVLEKRWRLAIRSSRDTSHPSPPCIATILF